VVKAVERPTASLLGCGTMTYLPGEGASTEITKRELVSSVDSLDIDLQSDESVGVCR
jgi:hypothetical protein